MPKAIPTFTAAVAIALVMLLVAILPACEPVDRAVDSLSAATASIERLASTVDLESQRWLSEAAKTRDELIGAGHSAIANDLDLVVQRGIQASGGEIRCTVDFVRGRVKDDIRSLVPRLLKKPSPTSEPHVCDVVPSVIDLNTKPGTANYLTVSGYDLDHTDAANGPMRLQLVMKNGQVRSIDEWVGKISHYKWTITIQPADQLALKQAASVDLLWGSNRSIIKIIQPTTQRWEEALPVGSQTLVPTHKGGDQDFDTGDDEAIKVVVWSEAKLENGTVFVRTYMWAYEWNTKHNVEQDDYTFAEGMSDWMAVKTQSEGQKFIRLEGYKGTGVQTHFVRKGVANFDLPAGSLVKTFAITGDRNGNEAGTYTQVTAHFHPIRVLVEGIR